MKLGLIYGPILVGALAMFAAGCESAPEEGRKPGPIAFVEDGRSDGVVVFLRGKTTSDRLVLEVVTRGAKSIQGVAFRVVWDPEALAFASAVAANAWSDEAVMLAKEGLPGQLVVAWSEKGESQGITLTDETVLGTLTFDAKSHKASTLAFRPERSSMLDATGARVAVAWRGGSVPVH